MKRRTGQASLFFSAVAAISIVASPAFAAEPATLVYHVSAKGDDAATGDAQHPFRTLVRLQEAIRANSDTHDIVVQLDDRVYQLDQPLMMGTADGGRNGHSVTWTGAPGAQPILSGGLPVRGWSMFDAKRHIYVATVPKGIEARELWVDDHLAPRTAIEIKRDAVRFTQTGLTIVDPALRYLATLPEQNRIEVEGTGFFTDRFSPVSHIDGSEIAMQQPGWDNNLWGYDTLANPHAPQFSHLFLVNSLAFLTKSGQWYIDPAAGKLYYRPPEGVDPNSQSIVLPRLPFLIGIAGTYEPIRNLTFRDIQFSYTSWLGPLSNRGYASQQSGTFLADASPDYPKDSLQSCKWGCRAFETMRNEWSQMPAAIQVARADNIAFDRDIFAHLGQIALGIGNDEDANASNIGLGAQNIAVTSNLFTDLAAGAIVVGGVRRAAHHPAEQALVNRDILIANNRVHTVSQEFRDNAAILSTYVTAAKIIHNDVSGAPYDGIDVGYGWGYQDVGGNPNYRVNQHGYDGTGNIQYQVPTTLRDTLVAYNRVHDVKQWFEDGGAIYNLSANPGAEIHDNYLYDLHGHIGLYLDEGSRAVVLRNNVVDGTGRWLNDNTVKNANPMRITIDNKAIGNWHNSTLVGGQWNAYQNDLIFEDHPVQGKAWPAAAKAVIEAAGIIPDKEPPAAAVENSASPG